MGSPGTERENFTCRGAIVVTLWGDIDIASAEETYHKVAAAVGAECAIVDLSEVEFVDATGIGVFIRLLKDVTLTGRHLLLARPVPAVRRVFETLRLTDTFQIYSSIESVALAHPVLWASSTSGPQRPVDPS